MVKPRGAAPEPRPTSGDQTPEDRKALLGTLHRLGFSSVHPESRPTLRTSVADLWVRPPGPRAGISPVLIETSSLDTPEARTRDLVARWTQGLRQEASPSSSAATILVVENDAAAELTNRQIAASSPVPLPVAISLTRILVHPRTGPESESPPHWHLRQLPPKVVLILATGTLIGLAQRAGPVPEGSGGAPIDVEGMFRELRRTLCIDIEGSLGVTREEDAMFLLYQLALRETYAPGDQGASLHELVNDPKGPAARLPWFAI